VFVLRNEAIIDNAEWMEKKVSKWFSSKKVRKKRRKNKKEGKSQGNLS